jgi:hypothetical protein
VPSPIAPPRDKADESDKLEVNVDGAWYTAKLHLREDGITTVRYDGYSNGEDDDLWDAQKIRGFRQLSQHLRVESKALQDEECWRVHVNMPVCGLRRTSSWEGWYDAFITGVGLLVFDSLVHCP